MENKTRTRILQRIEKAVSEGFYLRTMSQTQNTADFVSDEYGGVCVLGAIMCDGVSEVMPDQVAKIIDIDEKDLFALECGFEDWTDYGSADKDFYKLGEHIRKTYT